MDGKEVSKMTKLATIKPAEINTYGWRQDQIDLITRTVARGATPDELALFLYTAQRLGLDPLTHQIHFVKRKVWNNERKSYDEVGTIQVGIDGFRVIAERKERYAPGRAPEYQYKPDGTLLCATAFVNKLVGDKWFEISATAFYEEHAQTNKEGKPTKMWATMPHVMLAKCAESQALRKAFPADLANVYSDEEMMQADSEDRQPINVTPKQAVQQIPDGVDRAVIVAFVKELQAKGWSQEELANILQQATGLADTRSGITQEQFDAWKAAVETAATTDDLAKLQLDGEE
jgi:phage recombination protein Bet